MSAELDAVRESYERSLSWRVTRPLRALGRIARGGGANTAHAGRLGAFSPGHLDSWLEDVYGERLAEIDAACRDRAPKRYALFRQLEPELWALLLTREYAVYPNIRGLLPDVPDAGLQQLWNGASGIALAEQSTAFYTKVVARYGEHSARPLAQSRVLDFGCGWGRLTRFFARDVEPGALCGCDPVQRILAACRSSRVPATFARSAFVPDRLPFDGPPFDLAFSFSVFTHMSEPAHERCLASLHAALAPGAILVVTIRPPAYLTVSPLLHGVMRALGPNYRERLREPRYLFVPHPAAPSHYQYEGAK